MKVWINGRIVDPQDAHVSVFDHGLLYGDGVFEGLRFYMGRVFRSRQHLERLEESARAILLQMPYSLDELQRAMDDTIRLSGLTDGYIRLVVTRGSGALGLSIRKTSNPVVFAIVDKISLYPPELYETGMPIISSSVMAKHPSTLPARVKSLNYLPNILAKIEAQEAGVEEAVMYNAEGYVCEATADNIFVVKHGRVATPPVSCGLLRGVTRDVVIEAVQRLGLPEVQERLLTRHDLYSADEMFLTGTGAEVIAVNAIDSRPIGPIGTRSPLGIGPLTRQIMDEFRLMVREECSLRLA